MIVVRKIATDRMERSFQSARSTAKMERSFQSARSARPVTTNISVLGHSNISRSPGLRSARF